MKYDLAASVAHMDIGHLMEEVKNLEAQGISSFHVDIMDGRFVPNFSMSLNDLRCVAKYATKPIDLHLMIEQPCNQIELFISCLRKGDTVYIHPEAEYHPSTTLQKIIDAGLVPGIAINPGTSVETIMEMLNIVDKVLIMSVNPGEEESLYRDSIQKKLTKLISLKEKMTFDIFIDGAVTKEKIESLGPKGVDGFVIEDFDIINDQEAVTVTTWNNFSLAVDKKTKEIV